MWQRTGDLVVRHRWLLMALVAVSLVSADGPATTVVARLRPGDAGIAARRPIIAAFEQAVEAEQFLRHPERE